MKDKIFKIINNTFEKDYFLDHGSIETEKKLTDQIASFNLKYPNSVSDFLKNLRGNFQETQIEDWTHLFNLDRCIRFLVQFDEKRRYVCQLSIYNYFSVYHCPYHYDKATYFYGEKKFINQNELEVCDKMYDCANLLTEKPIWLDREMLNKVVFDLSIPKINHEYIKTVADVLFTEHYI